MPTIAAKRISKHEENGPNSLFLYYVYSILQVYAEISIISQSTFNTQLRDSDSSKALLPDNER
jgi:hypothetical protein